MPGEMYDKMAGELSKTRYATVSEYVRDLIRNDQNGGEVIARKVVDPDKPFSMAGVVVTSGREVMNDIG
jgi:hypothetical protein